MFVFRKSEEVSNYLSEQKKNGKQIGFVPTMGALHKGHMSLIECSVRDNDITAASIFVNPTQFNNASDLEQYPKNEQADFKLLSDIGCDAVFVPDTAEMYPEPDIRKFDFNGLDSFMEGAHRPGHFNGVAQIVTKLFDIIKPNNAYFGRKDFQQLAIIRYVTKTYQADLEINIRECDIMREPDGLAMSSRNLRLTPQHRKAAGKIPEVMLQLRNKAEQLSVKELKEYVSTEFHTHTLLKLEYFEIVDDISLHPITEPHAYSGSTACIAIYAGDVRLIDNVPL